MYVFFYDGEVHQTTSEPLAFKEKLDNGMQLCKFEGGSFYQFVWNGSDYVWVEVPTAEA